MKKILLIITFLVIFLISSILFLLRTNIGANIIVSKVISLVPGLKISSINGNLQNLKIKNITYESSAFKININELFMIIDFSYIINNKFYIKNLSLYNINIIIDNNKILSKSLIKSLIISSINNYLSTTCVFLLRKLNLVNIKIKIDKNNITIGKFTTGIIFKDKTLIVNSSNVTNLSIFPSCLTNLTNDDKVLFNKKINKFINKDYINYNFFIKKAKSKIIKKLYLFKFIKYFNMNFIDSYIKLIFNLPINIVIKEFNLENLNLFKNKFIIERCRLVVKITKQKIELVLINFNSLKKKFNISGRCLIENQKHINILVNFRIKNFLFRAEERAKLTIYGNLYNKLLIKASSLGPIKTNLLMNLCLKNNNLSFNLFFKNNLLFNKLKRVYQYQFKEVSLKYYKKLNICRFKLKLKLIGEDLIPIFLNFDSELNEDNSNILNLIIEGKRSLIKLEILINKKNNTSIVYKINLYDIKKQILNLREQFLNRRIKKYSLYYNKIKNENYLNRKNIYKIHLNDYLELRKIFSIEGSFFHLKNLNTFKICKIKLKNKNHFIRLKNKLNNINILNINFNDLLLHNIIRELSINFKGNINLTNNNINKIQFLITLTNFNLNYINLIINKLLLKIILHTCNSKVFFDIKFNIDKLNYKSFFFRYLNIYLFGNKNKFSIIFNGINNIFDKNKPDTFLHKKSRILYKIFRISSFKDKKLSFHNEYPHIKDENLIFNFYKIKIINVKENTSQNIEVLLSKKFILSFYNFILVNIKYYIYSKIENDSNKEIKKYLEYMLHYLDNNFFVFLNLSTPISYLNNKKVYLDYKQIEFNIYKYKDKISFKYLIKISKDEFSKGELYINYIKKDKLNLFFNFKTKNFSISNLEHIFQLNILVNGKVDSELNLFGSLRKIRTYGFLKINNLIINKEILSTVIKDSQLFIFFNKNTINIKYIIDTNNGSISIEGSSNYKLSLSFQNLSIKLISNLMHVKVLSLANLKTSFNITIYLTTKSILVKGNISLLLSTIEINNTFFSKAVSLSKKEIILDNELNFKNKNLYTFIPININLLIHISENVKVTFYNLKAKIIGDLKLFSTNEIVKLKGKIIVISISIRSNLETYE